MKLIDADKLHEKLLSIQMGAYMADDKEMVEQMNLFMKILLNQPAVSRWTKCESELPTDDCKCFVVFADETDKIKVATAYWCDGWYWSKSAIGTPIFAKGIIAWQPVFEESVNA